MKKLIFISLLLLVILISYGQSSFVCYKGISDSNFAGRYFASYTIDTSNKDVILIQSQTDSVFSTWDKDVNKSIGGIYFYKIDLLPEPQLYYRFVNEDFDYTMPFNYLRIREYKIQGIKYKVYCFGHISYEIDGDFAIYLSKEFGVLAENAINWRNINIRESTSPDDEMLSKLMKRMKSDNSFFPKPNFKTKHRLKK